MANTKSAEKMIRVSARKQRRNRPLKSSVRSAVTKARQAVTGPDAASASDLVNAAVRSLDKAAQKGILHPNNAARRKSRLMKRLNAAQAKS